MSLNRRAPKRDANETVIKEALRAAGATVEELSGKGIPDLLIGYQQQTVLAEVKSAKGKLTEAQETFHRRWKGGVIYILRTTEDAINMLNQINL